MTAERVLYCAQGGTAVPRKVEVKELEPNQVRVKVHCVGINPIDWKLIHGQLAEGTGQGNDFAGEVVEVGAEVKSVKVGDTVAGGVNGGDVDKELTGAFTPLLTVEEHLLFHFPTKLTDAAASKIPHGVPTTYQQAASLGIALDTSAIAFDRYEPKGDDEWVVVYGSSSSLGFIAAQYARNIGYNVIGVSSPHPELYSGLGIHFLDRHDPEWRAKARALANNRISFVYDTISQGDTPELCFELLGDHGNLSFSLPDVELDKSLASTKPGVVLKKPMYNFMMKSVKKLGSLVMPDADGHHPRAPIMMKRINDQLRKNEIITLPIMVLQGLDKVNEGLDLNRKGVSGRKVVVNV